MIIRRGVKEDIPQVNSLFSPKFPKVIIEESA